jgi:hypothetical protein
MSVGFSSLHSLLAPLVLNVQTGKISTQFYIIFDNHFKTVPSLPMGDNIQQWWHWIFKFPCECYLDIVVDQYGFLHFQNDPTVQHTNLPPHFELPLRSLPYDNQADLASLQPVGEAAGAPDRAPEGDQAGVSVGVLAGIPTNAPERVSGDNTNHQPKHDANVTTNDDAIFLPPVWPNENSDNWTTLLPPSCQQQQNIGTYKDGPAKIRQLPIDGKSYKLNILLENACDTSAAFIIN